MSSKFTKHLNTNIIIVKCLVFKRHPKKSHKRSKEYYANHV